ncbi:MAG: pilus assembly protein PilP [Bdellovibrionota bacterium]
MNKKINKITILSILILLLINSFVSCSNDSKSNKDNNNDNNKGQNKVISKNKQEKSFLEKLGKNIESRLTNEIENQLKENKLTGKNIKIKISQSKNKSKKEKKYTYNAEGKRDPFVKYEAENSIIANLNSKKREDAPPLEQCDIKQFKLTAVMSVGDTLKAIVENADGKGFIVDIGTKIGLNNGVITQILEDKIIISETLVDFTGKEEKTTIEMLLREKEDEKEE